MRFLLCHSVSDHLSIKPLGDFALNPFERTAANKQDIFGINGDKVLFGMLSPALRRHVYNGSFQQFKQGLLYSLSRHVTGNGGIIALTGNFIEFVNKYNSLLGQSHIVIGCLQETGKNTFHVFPHVTCFCKHSGIYNGKGHIQHLCYSVSQQRLACSGRTNQQDIGFFHFHIVFPG